MNDSPVSQNHMIDITDCLEAVSVFRGWKNFFFLVLLVCLVLAQASFWLIDRGFIEAPTSTVSAPDPIAAAASLTMADPNATVTGAGGSGGGLLTKLTFEHLARTIVLVDGVLLVTAVLFSMAMFFSLMVSLIGRLGGINHVARAFFLSLIMLVLIVPWQNVLGLNVPGMIYTPSELLKWIAAKSDGLLDTIFYYLRFSGYWLVVFLLLIMSQMRSGRWAKSILKRLEII
ncbi:MAG: hypothetical protein JW993_20335 [Sedimentisphaerales bacterium]|nr:hypothetical protein [Sedimentisphaerales bacterium]